MSVFSKLQKCRVELQNKNLKKSGKNKFANYDYYELSDFLPTINVLMNENKMCSIVSFTKDLATLIIIDTEDNTETAFTSPMAEAELKGCHSIQNLGAVETYQRRYLYMNAFEIVEHDALDGTTGKENKHEEHQENNEETISKPQQNRLYAIAKADTEKIKEVCTKYGYKSSKEIKLSDYNKISKELEA